MSSATSSVALFIMMVLAAISGSDGRAVFKEQIRFDISSTFVVIGRSFTVSSVGATPDIASNADSGTLLKHNDVDSGCDTSAMADACVPECEDFQTFIPSDLSSCTLTANYDCQAVCSSLQTSYAASICSATTSQVVSETRSFTNSYICTAATTTPEATPEI